MSRWVTALLLAATLVVFGAFCVVVIDERQQAFRTVLGDPDPRPLGISFNRAVLDEPGLYVRIPGLHQMDFYDKRLLLYDAEPRELYLADELAIEVDYYLTYRIVDPQLFRQRVRSRAELLKQLDDTSFSEVRNTLGQRLIGDLLSPERPVLMQEIARRVDAEMRPKGIAVTDLRIRRTEFPEANLARVFDRMRKERERFAKTFRAEGEEEARKIRSGADLEARVLRADAKRQATELRGEGDSEATRIYAEAYDQDPEFYAFLRSLEAYRLALDEQTTLILSPKVPFLRFLFREDNRSTR